MFAKFELKYGRGRCDRGILKGPFHLVGNTTSLFPLCLIFFFFFHKAPYIKRVRRAEAGKRRKGNHIAPGGEKLARRVSFAAATARAKKVINLEIFRMSRAYCTATPSKCRVYRIDKSSLPNQLSIVTRSNGARSFPGI